MKYLRFLLIFMHVFRHCGEHIHIPLASKNPFAQETAWHYPYPLDIHRMNLAARVLFDYVDFTGF